MQGTHVCKPLLKLTEVLDSVNIPSMPGPNLHLHSALTNTISRYSRSTLFCLWLRLSWRRHLQTLTADRVEVVLLFSKCIHIVFFPQTAYPAFCPTLKGFFITDYCSNAVFTCMYKCNILLTYSFNSFDTHIMFSYLISVFDSLAVFCSCDLLLLVYVSTHPPNPICSIFLNMEGSALPSTVTMHACYDTWNTRSRLVA